MKTWFLTVSEITGVERHDREDGAERDVAERTMKKDLVKTQFTRSFLL